MAGPGGKEKYDTAKPLCRMQEGIIYEFWPNSAHTLEELTPVSSVPLLGSAVCGLARVVRARVALKGKPRQTSYATSLADRLFTPHCLAYHLLDSSANQFSHRSA